MLKLLDEEGSTLDVSAIPDDAFSKSMDQPPSVDSDAPYGYKTNGEPKKISGRPRKVNPPPSVETLKVDKQAQTEEKPADKTPAKPAKTAASKKDDGKAPPYTPGKIAKGMTKLYTRVGQTIKAWDFVVGTAIIIQAEEIGAAWDEVARVNPRIRKFLLLLISGGAYGQLAMAHLPIAMAVWMSLQARMNGNYTPQEGTFSERLFENWTTGGADGSMPTDGTLLDGMTKADMEQVMALASNFMPQMMGGLPGGGLRSGP